MGSTPRRSETPLKLSSAIFWLAVLEGGLTGCCCRSAESAAEMRAELLSSNRERAEPLMRMAAEAVGATLLTALPTREIRVGACASPSLPQAQTCASWLSNDGLAFRRRDRAGVELVGVRVESPSWQYARLARRGNTLVVLVPTVTRQLESRQTQCECEGRSAGYVDFENDIESVFLVEDQPVDGVEVLSVPILEDFIEWRCALVVTAA